MTVHYNTNPNWQGVGDAKQLAFRVTQVRLSLTLALDLDLALGQSLALGLGLSLDPGHDNCNRDPNSNP